MATVIDALRSYAKLTEEELDWEFPTARFEGTEVIKGNQVLVFAVEDPRVMVQLLTSGLGKSFLDEKLAYRFSDGSKAKYLKCRNRYEFTQYGKLFAILKWRDD